MFKNKVGSDACLMLSATGVYDEGQPLVTIDQKFEISDLIEASKTKNISVRITSTDEDFIFDYGIVVIAFVDLIKPTIFETTFSTEHLTFFKNEAGYWEAMANLE